MIPNNFELLDNSKYFELYFNQELRLQSHMNFLFQKRNTYDKLIAEVRTILKEKYNMDIKENFVHIVYTTVMHQGDKKVLMNLFGKPKNTIRLGEGRASVWFIKINGKMVMLFADTRGMSIELEPNVSSDEFLTIMIDLFKCLYEGYEKYNDRLIDVIKNYKV